MLDRLDRLPEPQQDALGVTFGLREGGAPERLLVGLAVLSLMSDTAGDGPLLFLVDDAQWLDRTSVQALAFVARRVLAAQLALVFALREPAGHRELDGLPELVVAGLGDADADQLLAATVPGPMDDLACRRIVAEAHGNPRALLELPRRSTPANLAGGFGLPDTGPTATSHERALMQQIGALPPETRRLLLAAAADPVGDGPVLSRAAKLLGIGAGAAEPAAAATVIEAGDGVRFRHPLVRSAVYRTASPAEVQRVHAALARAIDPEADPDRRAWHRADATLEPDEAVAAELVRSAGTAQARGGRAAAAAFLEQATRTTPDPARRGVRAIDAAQAKLDAAAPDAASRLLATAELCPLDELQRARLVQVHAGIAVASGRASAAPAMWLDAARELSPLDASMARAAYLDALGAAVLAGQAEGSGGTASTAEAARSAPPPRRAERPVDLLLDGLVARFTEGYAAAIGPLRRAVEASSRKRAAPEDLRWLGLACRVAADLWEFDAWRELADRQVTLARDTGALTVLDGALAERAWVHVHAGELAAAAGLADEAAVLRHATGAVAEADTATIVAAWRGDETRTPEQTGDGLHGLDLDRGGRAATEAHLAAAVLHSSRGRFDQAVEAARRAGAGDQLALSGWALTELVEGAVRSGRTDLATAALAELAERADASGTDWARGIECGSRALVGAGDVEPLFREAIERLERAGVAIHVARARVAYGEWLRGEKRRNNAREPLRRGYEALTRMEAAGFAARARAELAAAGETVRLRSVEPLADLTAQEAQIARLARDGHTNPEIGTRLFISARTVEWHLHNVFAKLGISSRHEIPAALVEGSTVPARP